MGVEKANELKQLRSSMMKGITLEERHGKEKAKKIREALSKPKSEKHKKNLSLSKIGKKYPKLSYALKELHKKGYIHPMTGKKMSLKAREGLLKSRLGQVWITKYNQTKSIDKKELNGYISTGWKRGRK